MDVADDRQLSLWPDQPQSIEAEPRRYAEVSIHSRNTEADDFNDEPEKNHQDLLEQICSRDNLYEACYKVMLNKGASGVDKMAAGELEGWLDANYETLRDRLLAGKYKPLPVRRVEIPKEEKGKVRLLGIPTVADRMIQQAIVQVLTEVYESLFSDYSFGFRPNRSAHQALLQVQDYANEGYVWALSLDLERFFDTVNQSRLIQLLGTVIEDGRVISLIHRYLTAGVMINGVVIPTEEGTPQGGPLSPVLANILLNELDRELERRGHVFVRYADDCLILKKTRKAAERTRDTITTFIEKKLFLKVNQDKTYIAYLSHKVKYLGYGFYKTGEGWRLRVHPKSVVKLKDKVRAITARSNGWSLDWRRYKLKMLVTGWVKLADMGHLLREIDGWCRRRLRMVYWKQWKRIRTKGRALMKLGVPKDQAWQWANSRKAYWRIAGSAVLNRTLDTSKLKELGWATFSDRYQQVSC